MLPRTDWARTLPAKTPLPLVCCDTVNPTAFAPAPPLDHVTPAPGVAFAQRAVGVRLAYQDWIAPLSVSTFG